MTYNLSGYTENNILRTRLKMDLNNRGGFLKL